MKSAKYLLAFIIIIKIDTSLSRVKVAVYYETMCPHSINFVRNKFHPYYKVLKDYIQVEWIPYGRSNHTRVNGKWQIQCKNGKDECKSNKFQVCALEEGRSQDKNVDFITCVLSLGYPGHTRGIEDCADRNSFDWAAIMECFENGRGDELMAKMGQKTRRLAPRLKQVPTIVYNDTFDGRLCDLALNDFVKTTCSMIIGQKPSIC
ncbi:GILT-like protein 1 [Harmonia axyridis]|uniref:GILT-like protein 1 n=1 Tax=Harmonia axyridis TaxID=115357 RepID=UPI001E279BA9|nr:GILT-like protein 1 [Harmonia axyridis]